MGSCDIFFPTDFELLKRMHGEVLLWHVPMHLWLLWHVPIHMRHFLIISTEHKGPCDVDMPNQLCLATKVLGIHSQVIKSSEFIAKYANVTLSRTKTGLVMPYLG